MMVRNRNIHFSQAPTLYGDSWPTHTANQLAWLTPDNTSRDKYYCSPPCLPDNMTTPWHDSHEAKSKKFSVNKTRQNTVPGLTSSISIMSSSDSQQACWSWSARSSSCSSKSNISAILTTCVFVSRNLTFLAQHASSFMHFTSLLSTCPLGDSTLRAFRSPLPRGRTTLGGNPGIHVYSFSPMRYF